jgi:oxalate decarboxylase/phosphoglucose isomerase-like protein (cupin superfamily)
VAELKKKTFSLTKRVERGWGYELWIENEPEYCGKLLHIYAGKCCSLHFHANKMETMYLQSGHVKLRFIDPEKGRPYYVELFPGDSILIPRNTVHQIGAEEESDIFEFSTFHEEGDSFRVEKGD